MLTEHAHLNQWLSWRRLAGWTLFLTGLLHLGAEAFAPQTPAQRAMMTTMRGWHVSLPGVERSVADLFRGFSLTMGLLLIGCGALIATARPTRWSNVTMVALTLVAAATSWRYFFVVPAVLTTIAAAAALNASWRE